MSRGPNLSQSRRASHPVATAGDECRQLGVDPVGSSQEQFTAHIASETKRWAEVAQKANVKIE